MEIAALNTFQTVEANADTDGIIKSLINAVPAAAINLKTFARNHYIKGNIAEYKRIIVDLIRSNVKYKKDGFQNQNIKFPGRLLNDKTGDCKSLSLFFAGAMSAAGIKNGFRFVAYKPGDPTHVYNYYYDNRGRKVFIDLCTKDLKQTNFLTKKDMDVNYLAGPEIGRKKLFRSKEERKAAKTERRENRQEKRAEKRSMTKEERRAKKKEGRGGKKRTVKKIALAPARTAFLGLVKINFRGLATKFNKLEAKEPGTAKAFYNRLGGDYNKLTAAIKQGVTRRAFLGEPEEFMSAPPAPPVDPATLSALVGSAAAILAPLLKLFKSKGMEDKDTKEMEELEAVDNAEELGEGFTALDPDDDGDAKAASKGNAGGGLDMKLISPLIVIGAGVGLFILSRKK